MSWRTVVITGCAKLDYKMDYLVVRKLDTINRIHLSEIGLLLIDSTAVSLTTMLLSELTKRKTKVIFCDHQHNPQAELTSYYGSHDTSAKIKKQIEWSLDLKTTMWTEIVSEKIRKQAELLAEYNHKNQSEMLSQYLREIEYGDSTNREGHAAKVYFNALFGLEFTRSAENAINAALNYGYSLILSCFTKEIVAAGYLTQLGLFHDNMFNPFNLASDLMEPFRILVDRRVIKLAPTQFEHGERIYMMHLLEEEVYIEGRRQYINNAIRMYCLSVFDALNEGDPSLIRFYRNEL